MAGSGHSGRNAVHTHLDHQLVHVHHSSSWLHSSSCLHRRWWLTRIALAPRSRLVRVLLFFFFFFVVVWR